MHLQNSATNHRHRMDRAIVYPFLLFAAFFLIVEFYRFTQTIEFQDTIFYLLPPSPREITPVARHDRRLPATLLVAVSAESNMSYYTTARNTVECYGALHGYNVSIGYDNEYKECVKHKNFFFRRHCHGLMVMREEIAEDEWVLFIDADIGVVNPNKLIEEYIEPGYEIYLFDRFFNWEYSLNSYLVRNNARGREWVRQLAEYEFNVPNSKHGEDNGALHPLMMKWLVPESMHDKTINKMSERCISVWNHSKDYGDVFQMEACTRLVIGERNHFPEHKIKIISKGYGWAQDLWLLHSHWSTDNFMMHAIKEKNFNKTANVRDEVWKLTLLKRALANPRNHSILLPSPFNGDSACDVVFPVLNTLDIEKCKANTERWVMEPRLEIDAELRTNLLDTMANILFEQQISSIVNLTMRLWED